MALVDTQKDGLSQKGAERPGGCLRGVLVLALLAALPFVIYFLLVGVGAVLIVADPIEAVDAVVVLSGDDGDRLALALQMHEQGFAPNLVITDTHSHINRRLKAEAIDGGFPAGSIYITPDQVESTVDEARAVLTLAEAQGWDKLMVVTDPFHSFRARFIFRRELRGSGISVFVRPVVGHWFRSPSWFLHPEGWQFVFLEVAKLLGYVMGF
jgi:uncharacterized SAM-binding protein YcdF (DUF218 family)